VDLAVCRVVLENLVRAHFLRVTQNGSYTRSTEGTPGSAAAAVSLPKRRRR
jgi:hypothetical protein